MALHVPSRRSVIVAILLVGTARPGPAQETRDQFWPELDAYVELSATTRLFLLLAPVRERGSGIDESQIGAHLEVGVLPFARSGRLRQSYDEHQLRYLRLRVGYRRTFSFESGRNLTEERVIAEFTPRAFLPGGVVAAVRNRVDLRWIEGDYSWRYRPRLWIERETPTGPVVLVPYGSAEVFYDSRDEEWSRTRYQLGLGVAVARWLVPELYYAYQIDRQPSLLYTNALGAVVTLYF